MAEKPLCSFNGCSNTQACRGLCMNHYIRARKRGEIQNVLTKYGSGLAFVREALASSTDECINWPFGKSDNGYGGGIVYEGRKIAPHRLVCELTHGKPKKGIQACHSCGNRACVNPRHLRFGTQSDNEADKYKHGRRAFGVEHPWTKLTEGMVIEIRQSPLSAAKLAKKFSMSRAYLSEVRTGRRWAHVEGARKRSQKESVARGSASGTSKLTEENVREIRRSSERSDVLADRFKVRAGTIRGIRSGRGWTHVS